ncbi:MAG: cytochrome c3 family protein [Thermodesulfobacteriota bacterium]
MKRGKKSVILLCGLLLLAGGIAVAAQTAGTKQEEAYDESTYGPANPILWTKPVKAVVFSHKTHTMGAGLGCDSCHDAIFEMAAGTAQEKADFTMDSLYKGKYCGACHDGNMAFASNTRCATCHVGVKGYNKLTGADAKKSGKGGH